TAQHAMNRCLAGEEDPGEILGGMEETLLKLGETRVKSGLVNPRQILESYDGGLNAFLDPSKRVKGISTGFYKLDEMTGGMHAGDLFILAARPSMGKTALALNIAEQMAMRGEAVGIFSMEMSKQQLVQRMLASRAAIDSHRMRRNMLNRDEHRALMTACDELLDARLFIDDTPGLSLLQLRAKARRMQQKHGISAIVIDYLQLMTSGRKVESRQLEVSEISRGVKAMARELGVPVLCLSQLNRSPEMRAGHKPMMSDLRESGSIEQDADVVSMLHREDYYHKDDPEWEMNNPGKAGVAELILTKQRNGPTGVVYLTWVASSMRFKDHSPHRGEGYSASSHSGPAFPGAAYSRDIPQASGSAISAPFKERGRPRAIDLDEQVEGDLPI
ncbi:MAG TPA: replicative DNA helicase, partial [Phycisphaerales bacterium]|nr:replicative DNA helicase [Phycisphaerales bacterium]